MVKIEIKGMQEGLRAGEPLEAAIRLVNLSLALA